MQARFQQCGGCDAPKYDSVPISGCTAVHDTIANAMANIAKVYGFSGDSGIKINAENLYSCIEGARRGGTATANDTFRVRCQIPIHGAGLFSPFSPSDPLAASCPYRRSMNALVNMNNFSLEILTSDLYKNIFRSLSALNGTGAGDFGDGNPSGRYTVQLAADDKPRLCTTWLRLASWRALPATIVASTYRITSHRPTSEIKGTDLPVINQACLDGAAPLTVLPSIGSARKPSARSAPVVENDNKYWTAKFEAVQFSQLPQYLFFVFQKSTDLMTLDR